jgi:signal transduction histidine kinase
MAQDSRRARPDLDDRYGVRCFVAVPLIWQAERLGVVTLAFTEPHALSESDLALACALAEQAAVAVAHARDYAEEQRLRAESEEIMRQFVEQSQQLERVQRQLIQNEKLTAIGQLIQGLAHEMNTPLSVVIANLSVLGRYAESLSDVARAAQQVLPQLQADPLAAALVAPLDEAVQAADLEYVLDDLPALVDESSAGARRVADLVRSVGTFARRDTNGPQPLAIGEVLEAALNLASNELKHRARVERAFADNLPPVLGLASELTQVFVHLLINAAQALKDAPGRVTVGVAHTGADVTVTVTDTGRGIAPEHLERVFEPFFTTRAPGEGTGMGLAVCYGIIQRHGGWIGIDSHPGEGTRVTVRLPLAETAPHEQAA